MLLIINDRDNTFISTLHVQNFQFTAAVMVHVRYSHKYSVLNLILRIVFYWASKTSSCCCSHRFSKKRREWDNLWNIYRMYITPVHDKWINFITYFTGCMYRPMLRTHNHPYCSKHTIICSTAFCLSAFLLI